MDPITHTTTHIEIKLQCERHTINRAELTAITLALEANREIPALSILIDSVFSINTLLKYDIDPLSFIHNPQKNLLKLADDVIHTRDTL